jgi:hypothetical protein
MKSLHLLCIKYSIALFYHDCTIFQQIEKVLVDITVCIKKNCIVIDEQTNLEPCSGPSRTWSWPLGCRSSIFEERRSLARTRPNPGNLEPTNLPRCRCSSTGPASTGPQPSPSLRTRSRFRTTSPGIRYL